MAYKNKKLHEQFAENAARERASWEPQASQDATLFSGVSIFVNGLTDPPHLVGSVCCKHADRPHLLQHANGSRRGSIVGLSLLSVIRCLALPMQELKQIMALHGGRFVNYYSRDTVTHIICSNLTDAKVKIFERER